VALLSYKSEFKVIPLILADSSGKCNSIKTSGFVAQRFHNYMILEVLIIF